jgi:hypothetical protein
MLGIGRRRGLLVLLVQMPLYCTRLLPTTLVVPILLLTLLHAVLLLLLLRCVLNHPKPCTSGRHALLAVVLPMPNSVLLQLLLTVT